ncbi:uncharacterized protein LOC111362022 isoform X2 [Spodoptera litura]|uniref:Uncharacterized protein LOC111362022 isoform X2 n=1 Tax=Spodoptera litura TaxID=69820 RepID=A0A9J7J0J0_SPOLT|nr:uncharacterized protein LOC111362022 isoform X2 [Spodoptera litura]
MNSDSSEGKPGGVIIKPSARRSIHSYKNDRLRSNETMGRYGLNKSNNQTGPDAVDKGVDEVDNVMSKMARQTSPLSIRKNKLHRKNSYSQDSTGDFSNSDDSTLNVLSKSLPATLPSHFHYSDDSDVEGSYSNSLSKSRAEDKSYQSVKNRSNISSERDPSSPHQQKLIAFSRVNPGVTQPQPTNTSRSIILPIFLVVIAAFTYYILKDQTTIYTQEKSTQTNYDEIIFENNLRNLQEKYNIDDDSILQLKSGISTIISRMDTGSFMFVYNGKNNNFDAVKFGKFTDEVAYTAAKYLRSDMSSIQHTIVESANLDMQEHAELISRYRDDVNRSGVMLVKEIDAVPSDLAMAFHYYCDEYDPLVKKSAIFFTLNKANCSNTPAKATHDFVEKCLTKKWKTVSAENLRPLLTRVVNVIIDVTSAF